MTKKTDKMTSRRVVLQAGLGLGIAATAGTASAQTKLAHNIVQYQPTPKDGARCDACVNWVPPNACNIVESPIAPAGWCVAFAPKG